MKFLKFITLGLLGLILVGTAPTESLSPDHHLLTAVLQDHVQAGRVDYAAVAQDDRLPRYLDQLARTDPELLPSRAEKLALWINAYNAYTLKLVADDYPINSIHNVVTGGMIIGWLLNRTPWDIRFAEVGGKTYTLNEIEHEIIRPQFQEPRIHFAIVCAAVSCPPLRTEAFVAERLDAQLDEQGREFLADERHNEFDLSTRVAVVSKIFAWFDEDFGSNDTEILAFLAGFAPELVAADMAARPEQWLLRHGPYDWSVNNQRDRD